MIDYTEQLKLQAYLDGELSEGEARQVAERLAGDPEAAALVAELRQTRQTVAAFQDDLKLPETREFYWSKIQREIERQAQPAQEPETVPGWLAMLRRVLMPLTAIAMVALITMMVGKQSSSQGSETALRDSGALTYHDFEKGATLVWLSYPADNEFADYEAAMFE